MMDVASHEVKALEVHERTLHGDVDGTVDVAERDAVLVPLGGVIAHLQHGIHADDRVDVLLKLPCRGSDVLDLLDGVRGDGLDAHLRREVEVLLRLVQVGERELPRLEIRQQPQDHFANAGAVQLKTLLAYDAQDLQVGIALHGVLQGDGPGEHFLEAPQSRTDLALHHHVQRRAVLAHELVHGDAFNHHHPPLVLGEESLPAIPHVTV
jgi:hypothetical protein